MYIIFFKYFYLIILYLKINIRNLYQAYIKSQSMLIADITMF